MLQKYYRVRFLDLKETCVVAANNPKIAEDEACKVLRDRGTIADVCPRPPGAFILIGRLRVARAREYDAEV